MIYSVWNQGARRFDYYETPEPAPTVNAEAPKHLRDSKLGLTPKQASWPLPAGARKTGSGALARGRIAHPGGGGALGGLMDASVAGIPLLPVAAVGAVIYFMRKRRR